MKSDLRVSKHDRRRRLLDAKAAPPRSKKSFIMRDAGQMWGHLREAIDHLSSLPHPSDVAEHVRLLAVAPRVLNHRLPIIIQWLQEFQNEWNARAPSRARARGQQAGTDDVKRGAALGHRTVGDGGADDAGKGPQAA
jgi:hypothetical protein